MVQDILKQINKINNFFIGKNISYIKYTQQTLDNSIYTQIGLNGYDVYLEIFFNSRFGVKDVCVNVYKDKECIFTYAGEMEECFTRLDIFSNNRN